MILAQSCKFSFLAYRGSIRAIQGVDKVFKIWDRHHRIRRQILRKNEGLIFILAQRGGGGGGGGGGVGSGRVVYHTSTGQYIGVATFFFFFFFFLNFKPWVKLDEKSIENGLEGQKFLVVSFLGWFPPP